MKKLEISLLDAGFSDLSKIEYRLLERIHIEDIEKSP
jgi:hypothetical protein